MRFNFLVLGLLLISLFGTSEVVAKGAPLVDQKVVFEDATKRTSEEVREYILAGTEKSRPLLESAIDSDAPGILLLSFNKANKHFFTVEVTYDGDGFQVKYVGSKNLSFSESNGERFIHGNYSVWIDAWIKQIKIAQTLYLTAKGEPSHKEKVARLSFSSAGSSDRVVFSKSDEANICNTYDKVGTVAYHTQSEILARENEKKEWNEKYKTISIFGVRIEPPSFPPQVQTIYVPASHPIHIRGQSGSTDYSTGAMGQTSTLTKSCGPIIEKFTPEGGKEYLIEFTMTSLSRHGECMQRIYDVTDPNIRKPILVETASDCLK